MFMMNYVHIHHQVIYTYFFEMMLYSDLNTVMPLKYW